jgi:hypothetical protein
MAVIDPSKNTIVNGISSPKSEANQSNKRRSRRVVIDVAVTLFGQNPDGKIFEEKTKTVSVNAHGCLVVLKTELDPQKPVLLVNARTGAEVQCRSCYRKEIEKGLVEVGLAFVVPSPCFWCINFPPEDWNSVDRKKPIRSETPTSTMTKEILT